MPASPAASSELTQAVAALRPTLIRRALRLVPSLTDAEDLVQDAIERAYLNLESFTTGTNELAWLTRIMTNLAVDRWRRDSRRVYDPRALDELAAPAVQEQESDPVWRNLTVADVRDAAGRLPPVLRAVFQLRLDEQLSLHEIAARAGVPPQTVGTRLFRARARLRAALTAIAETRTTGSGGGATILPLWPVQTVTTKPVRERTPARRSAA